MADGAKKEIEKIELGDLVLATDPETGKTSARAVVTTITGTGVKDLVTVSVTDGSGQTGQVTATAGHPFWVPDIEEWVDAGELRPGMWVQTSSGTWVQVTAIEHDHREQTVHNLTIDTTHTYSVYAGADDAILTHNCGTGAAAAKPATESEPFAMGISDHLDDFASRHGASTWKNLPDPVNWKPGVLDKLSDPNQRVLFNLDGVDVWPGVTRAASGRGGATDWELFQIRGGSFPNLEFWRGGVRVGNPFE
ncbi:polymorphic toxin-type HINT domain-containing protein [Microbacterium sp. B19(2022)]|uniref:polymorphic toxin-type HINT domain-containing protein n=1 Tax=Microbacterium sp. B19(2022) TaxID=2914045 RepID=UPI001F404343|nr:polymorphic toxin-type HINT domain-containing protein [Microbacterium sp. B19(2022)]